MSWRPLRKIAALTCCSCQAMMAPTATLLRRKLTGGNDFYETKNCGGFSRSDSLGRLCWGTDEAFRHDPVRQAGPADCDSCERQTWTCVRGGEGEVQLDEAARDRERAG